MPNETRPSVPFRSNRRMAAFFFCMAALFAAAACLAESPSTHEIPPVSIAPDVWDGDWSGKIVAIPVEGAIFGKPFSDMPAMVERALDKADRDGALLIVVEMDSPGGDVEVCDRLSKRIFEAKTPTIALVLHKAVSGGAMLASAAREIVMTRSARMGDIQPMLMSFGGDNRSMDERTAEKMEVDIRTIMKVYAEARGRPSAVMEAMVSRASSLYQVKFRSAPTAYLTGHELEVLEKNIELGRDRRRIADTKIIKPEGKLLELSSQQTVEYGIASEVVDSRDAFYASRNFGADEVVRPRIAAGELDLKKLLPKVEDLGLPIWVVVLLGVFLVVGVAGLVTEYHAPGSGVPAAIGICGFVCFFATLFMHDRGSPLGIAIFLIGIILLVVEIMVLPGFGVAGIVGMLCILGGMLLAFTPDWGSDYMQAFMWNEVGAFTLLLLLGLAAAVGAVAFISRYGERLPYLSRFFLTDAHPAGENPYPDTLDPEPRESARMRLLALKGRSGTAETMLRPAGKVRLDSGELLDVVTDGVYIEAGKRVTVLEAAPNRIMVGIRREG